MIIGITGSIGSGKTTAANLFKKYGFKVINADKIGHQVMKKGSIAHKKIISEFGSGILDKNKNINRKKLGEIVFSDYVKLKKLNLIMHPLILSEIKDSIEKIGKQCKNKKNIVIDAPLLLETPAKKLVEKVIVVKANKKAIMKRLSKKYPRQKIEKILKAQMPMGEKARHADFIIDNCKGKQHLKNQVENIIGMLNPQIQK